MHRNKIIYHLNNLQTTNKLFKVQSISSFKVSNRFFDSEQSRQNLYIIYILYNVIGDKNIGLICIFCIQFYTIPVDTYCIKHILVFYTQTGK